MTDKTYTTKSGKTLTDADIEQPAEVVPVRSTPSCAPRSKHARPPIRPRPTTSSEKPSAASSTSPEVPSRRTEFGRTGREKDGEHRSPMVTHGQHRTLENKG